jgi:glutamine amidotransferase
MRGTGRYNQAMIGIVDYGMGNLHSVEKAFEKLGHRAQVVSDRAGIEGSAKLVLPGVGAFRDAIGELRRRELAPVILEHLAEGKPFLGICLGLQLLMETSYEDGTWEGLGVLGGEVVRFAEQPGLKIPHMGWNRVEVCAACPLFDGLPRDGYFYFVHSYYVVPDEEAVIAAHTSHGVRFPSVIQKGRMFATQFHPEKSQRLGLGLLANFARLE